jgi:hypothetical protein
VTGLPDAIQIGAVMRRGLLHFEIVTRRRVFRLAMIVCLLAAVDVGLWCVRGKKALYRGVPAMARVELETTGGRVPYGLDIKDIVVLSPEPGSLEPPVLQALRAAFAAYGLSLRTEAELGPGRRITDRECPGCLAFAYGIHTNTPVFAEVQTNQFLYSGGASHFRHRRWWFFGLWLPISDDLVGQE